MSTLGRRILDGEKAGNIPVIDVGANAFVFNWTGMQAFGVTLDQLPSPCELINKPFSFYEKHYLLIWGVIGVITLLSLMVLVLIRIVILLRYAQQKYRSIFDNATEGIYQSSLKGRILSANQAMADILGYASASELKASVQSLGDQVYHDSTDRKRFVSQLKVNKKVSNKQFRMHHRDGRLLWVNVNAHLTTESNGDTIVEGTIVDITEKKQSELAIAFMRNYLSNIVDSMPSMLVGVDRDGCVTLLNRKAEEETALESGDVKGKRVAEVIPWLEPFTDVIQESIVEQVPRQIPKVTRHVEGRLLYEDITIFPLISNEYGEAMVRIDDVSRGVQMERMMVQSEKMLSIGGLAAGMAHEINNPLAAVIGYAHNMRKRLFKNLKKNEIVAEECGVSLERMQEYLRQRQIPAMLDGITESGERAARIVSNMLNFSRKTESAGKDGHSVVELLDRAVTLAVNVYDMQRQFDFNRIEVVREYEAGLPDVVCDGNEMEQVFLNLLKNGAEAMAEKEYGDAAPRFILRAYQQGDRVMIEVEDNGPGIPEHVIRRVMEPFFTTKPVGRGTGLGLSVSYFIVTDLHKGSMEVFSEEGLWTRFVLGLPRHGGDAD